MPDLSQIMQMMNEMKSQMPSDSSSHVEESVPDMETMIKLAKIMSKINDSQNNAETNLLYALKPFLRESKKGKVDQYAQFLKMSSILNEMNKSGGG